MLLRGVRCWGGCLVLEGSAPRGVCFGGSAPGGLFRGGGIPACTEVDPPVDRMTDMCKNITFATSLRTVKIRVRCQMSIVLH